MHKDELRKVYLQKRLDLSDSEINDLNTKLTEKLISKIEKLAIQEVYIFLPIENNKEFDCRPLAKKLWSKGIKTFVPVSDFKTKTMKFANYDSGTKLEEKKYGIFEPINPAYTNTVNPIVITPLLITDKKLNRIGYGGGFYDRLFCEYPNIYKLGVSCFEPIDTIIETNEFDIPLDELIW